MARTPEKSREYQAAYRERNPEKSREAVRAWRQKNRDKDRAAAKRWAREHSEEAYAARRAYRYLSKYGITIEQYEAMLSSQNGVCAICNQPPKNGRKLSIDHNHDTRQVRALLCVSCNTGVGYFERPISMAIQEYLERHNGL